LKFFKAYVTKNNAQNNPYMDFLVEYSLKGIDQINRKYYISKKYPKTIISFDQIHIKYCRESGLYRNKDLAKSQG